MIVRNVTLLCAILNCLNVLAAGANPTGQLVPVNVNIGGVRLDAPQQALSNGRDTFVPISALKLLGATWKVDRRDETVKAEWGAGRQHSVFAIVRPDGQSMLALDDLARAFGGLVVRPNVDGSKTSKVNGDVYLLAIVRSIVSTNTALDITTSFPVTANVWMIDDAPPRRGIVDLYGCYLPDGLVPASHANSRNKGFRIRAAQRNFSNTRVVAELGANKYLRVGQRTASPGVTTLSTTFHIRQPGTRVVINVPVAKIPQLPVQRAGALSWQASGADSGSHKPLVASTTQVPAEQAAQAPTSPNVQPATVPNGTSVNNVTSPQTPVNAGNVNAQEADGAAPAVTAIQYNTISPTQATIVVSAGGTVYPVVHYLSGGSLEIVLRGLPLNLTVPGQNSIILPEAIISRIESIQTPEIGTGGQMTSKADTRIKIESQRFLGFSLDRTATQVVINLRVPDNADGDLAGKLIVVDPGHGGADTGAQAGGYAEKNIVLLIARKLRDDLEQAGARVVMTRDRDETVALASRPALANQIHADFYISIHNDCCSVPNTASGTTTYFHMQDASSRALANSIQQAIAAVSGLPSRGARSDGMLYQHGLEVLRDSNMPAVLIEVAYINNERDRSYLINPEFQSNVAAAIVTGLRGYVQGMPQTADAANPNKKIQIAQGH